MLARGPEDGIALLLSSAQRVVALVNETDGIIHHRLPFF
jgi:hypothetical protein